MEKKKQCCTPEGQIKRYIDCVGCDKKPMDTMSNKKQSSIDWLVEAIVKHDKSFKEFYGAEIQQAKAINNEEKLTKKVAIDFIEWIGGAFSFGNIAGKWYSHINPNNEYTSEQLYELYLKENNE